MTNKTAQRPVQPPATHRRRGAPSSDTTTLRSPSLIAGIALLVMVPLAIFSNFVVFEGLVTPGDAAATARDIMGSEGLFRLGTVGWLAIGALDVVAAWALFRIFAPAGTASRLAAWLRVGHAVSMMLGTVELTGAVRLLDSGRGLVGFSAEQLQTQALLRTATFDDMFNVGLLLFGLHLAVLGYLAYRSGYIPRLVGVLLVIAGAGYVTDTVTAVLGQPTNLGVVTFVGEFVLAIWLLVRGRSVVVRRAATAAEMSGS